MTPANCPDECSPRRSAPPAVLRPSSPRIRVLLATAGWPSGILEVGSWAARSGLADVVIFQIGRGIASPAEPAAGGGPAPENVSDPIAGLVEKLVELQPHVVGFRVEGEPFEPIQDWIGAVRRFSNAEIVLGGPTATSHPAGVLEWSGADYVFAGEAEETFTQFLSLAREHHSRDRLPEIPGIAYRYGDRTCFNTLPADGYGRTVVEAGDGRPEVPIGCLRSAVRPAVSADLLAANRLDWSLLEGFEQPLESLYFTAGRGCPGECSFCGQLHGARVRVKPASQLLEEIEAADRCVAEGRLHVTRWKLFAHVEDPRWQARDAAWAAVYDEDFFLDRSRAVEFFELWDNSPLNDRYRLSFQTNPRSLLAGGVPCPELFGWIDRVKPMVQLGAESFHPGLLARWRKRHNLEQLSAVLDALDATRQDYTVFQLLTDYESTAEELIETLRRLILAALARPRMRIASSPLAIPLYESDMRRELEFSGRLPGERIGDWRDYERPHPEWMDPLAAKLADLADSHLDWAINPETRDAALIETMAAVVEHLERASAGRFDALLAQARSAATEIAEARFQFCR